MTICAAGRLGWVLDHGHRLSLSHPCLGGGTFACKTPIFAGSKMASLLTQNIIADPEAFFQEFFLKFYQFYYGVGPCQNLGLLPVICWFCSSRRRITGISLKASNSSVILKIAGPALSRIY